MSQQNKHPLIDAVKFLVTHMDNPNRTFWQAEARRKKLKLEQMIAIYIFKDFGIPVDHEVVNSLV